MGSHIYMTGDSKPFISPWARDQIISQIEEADVLDERWVLLPLGEGNDAEDSYLQIALIAVVSSR